MRQYKIVVVGDGSVGKTSLLNAYIDDIFDGGYEATVFDNKETNIVLDGKDHYVTLLDTAGQESYSSVRPLSYQQTDVFIICFSIDSDSSFGHIKTVWLPELQHHQQEVPFIIVGTKQDLRGASLLKPDNDIDRTDGMRTEDYYEKISSDLGAKHYIESSAKTRFNVERVFELALTEALKYSEQVELKRKKMNTETRKSICSIL